MSSSTEWGDGEIRKIPRTKDTLRTKRKEAKRTEKFKTSTRRGRCPQRRKSPCSAPRRRPSRARPPSTWGGRGRSGHPWKSGRGRTTETREKNVVLSVDERGTLKKSARSSKALQVWTLVTLRCVQSQLKGNLFLRAVHYSVIFLSLTKPVTQRDFVFKKLKSSPPQILIFYKS